MTIMEAKPLLKASEIRISHLKFNIVVASDRRVIGTIDDLVVHKKTHEFAYAVLKVDTLLGFGNKRIPIPIEFFEVDPERSYRIKLLISRQKLKNAPKISAENLPGICQEKFLQTIHEYYRSEPMVSGTVLKLQKLFRVRLKQAQVIE